MKRLVLAATFALAALAPSLALAAPPKVGTPAPDFTLPSTKGPAFALSSLKGKPVYLNFFASWCGPCNDEAPSIGRLSTKYRAKGLAVVGVDELESAEKAKSFLAQYHLTYPAAIDADGHAGHSYGAIGLPAHVFIDRKGIVRTIRLGEMDPAEIEAAIKAIL